MSSARCITRLASQAGADGAATGWVRAAAGAFRLQLWLMPRDAQQLMALVNAPLFTVILMAIVTHHDRGDLAGSVVVAAGLITMWSMALLEAGDVVDVDRNLGTIEPAVVAPAGYAAAVLGRVAAVTTVSLLGFGEAALVAWLLFDAVVVIHHPVVLAVALAATALATSGTSMAMAALFVATRTARTFQNSLSYPFYVLGGVLTPVALLPGWLEPLSRAVYLSWAADLLRDSLEPTAVAAPWVRTGVVLLLGAGGLGVGRWLLARMLRRVRASGTVGLA